MKEDKQAICNAFCQALRLTSAAGSPINNPLIELKYMTKEEGGLLIGEPAALVSLSA